MVLDVAEVFIIICGLLAIRKVSIPLGMTAAFLLATYMSWRE